MFKSICLICCYLSLKSTVGCPSPINYTVPDITNNNVSYTATGLIPYTHYMVKVVAINGVGEGRPVNSTVTTDEEGSIILNFIIIAIVPLQIHCIYISFNNCNKQCEFLFVFLSVNVFFDVACTLK